MPEISRFFGIVICMYKGDHLPPHFHARYADDEAMISINNGEIIKGNLSNRALKLVIEWANLHKEELIRNFEESQKDNPDFLKIDPLK